VVEEGIKNAKKNELTKQSLTNENAKGWEPLERQRGSKKGRRTLIRRRLDRKGRSRRKAKKGEDS